MSTRVFPTLVGVFLIVDLSVGKMKSLPHARGGVSHSTPALHADAGSLPHARGGVSFGAVEADPATVSSPRSWGCFRTWGKCQ